MTRPMKEPTEPSNGHDSAAPHLNGTEPKAPPLTAEGQLRAFHDLARRIHTDRSVHRFEAALRTLLQPMKQRRSQETTAQPPTHNPKS